MPFIHIKSLPFEKFLDMKAVLEGISEDFSHETEIAWSTLRPLGNFSCEIVHW